MDKYNLKMIHIKVLLTTFIFCAIGGFYEAVSLILPVILHDSGYSAFEIGFTTYTLNMLVFILDSALFFVLLYSICRRNFMENIANIVTSLIIGTVFGIWIGGLLGSLAKFQRSPASLSIFIISILLSEFGACSAAYLNTKWDRLTSRANITPKRPFGVVLISVLYVILGFLSTFLALTLLGLLDIKFDIFFSKVFLYLPLVILFSVLSIAYFFIAHRFYKAKRWAWFAVFTSAIVGITIFINQLIFQFSFNITYLILRITLLLIDAFILIYLIQPSVRIYFGVINPASES